MGPPANKRKKEQSSFLKICVNDGDRKVVMNIDCVSEKSCLTNAMTVFSKRLRTRNHQKLSISDVQHCLVNVAGIMLGLQIERNDACACYLYPQELLERRRLGDTILLVERSLATNQCREPGDEDIS